MISLGQTGAVRGSALHACKNLVRLMACSLPIFSASLQAQVIVVDSTVDDGSAGTLRRAINQHQANGTSQPGLITFDGSVSGQTIVLNGTPLPVIDSGDLSISGFDASDSTVTGNKKGYWSSCANAAARCECPFLTTSFPSSSLRLFGSVLRSHKVGRIKRCGKLKHRRCPLFRAVF